VTFSAPRTISGAESVRAAWCQARRPPTAEEGQNAPARPPRGTCSARAGRIDEPPPVSAVAALADLYAQLRIIAIDEPLAREAGDLASQHALRGYDAVHLACAVHLEGDDILLATWDNALNFAARASGQLIANDTG
jgi:hypothetical protein